MSGDGDRIYYGEFDGGVLMASITNIDKMNMTKSSKDKEGSHLSNKNIVFDTKELNLMVW